MFSRYVVRNTQTYAWGDFTPKHIFGFSLHWWSRIRLTELETACPLYSGHPIIILPARTTTAAAAPAVAATTWLNGCGSRVTPGLSISSASCAPAGRLSVGVAPNPCPQHGTPHPIREQPGSANRTFRFRRTRLSTRRVRAAASSVPRAKLCTQAL